MKENFLISDTTNNLKNILKIRIILQLNVYQVTINIWLRETEKDANRCEKKMMRTVWETVWPCGGNPTPHCLSFIKLEAFIDQPVYPQPANTVRLYMYVTTGETISAYTDVTPARTKVPNSLFSRVCCASTRGDSPSHSLSLYFYASSCCMFFFFSFSFFNSLFSCVISTVGVIESRAFIIEEALSRLFTSSRKPPGAAGCNYCERLDFPVVSDMPIN